jgi:hypothetical protein
MSNVMDIVVVDGLIPILFSAWMMLESPAARTQAGAQF